MFEWATGIIEQTGYLGVVFAMFLENIIPPLPSELIMLFAGAGAASGDLNIFLTILAGVVGSALGLVPWYYAGKWYGQKRLKRLADRYGRLLTLAPHDIEAADDWFKRHGKTAVFFGRFLPAVRTLVAIPAGIMGMPLGTLIVVALFGSAVYDGAFAVAGYYAGENATTWEPYINGISYVSIAVIAVWYVYRVVTFRHEPPSP